MLNWLFGNVNKMSDNAKGNDLHFRDDGNFFFRKLLIFKAALVIKKQDRITDGWLHRYDNQFAFTGFKNIPGGKVTITTPRDIIYEPFKVVNNADKPDPARKGEANQEYITSIFDSAVREAQKQKPKGLIADKLAIAGIITIILFALAIFIGRVT